jgi:flagellar biosynthesis protein FlhA
MAEKRMQKILLSTSMPVALAGILGILMVPIPNAILDVCIALNITISLIILFASLFIDKILNFTSFPAILLVTTLFRLAMNVASTRMILLHGHEGMEAAGAVIKAFGEFVVGGNFAVGIVIFIAINIVNLKVITKGSTRIAEVAARFTLDAMPGKQMAIDSDLNSGLINEAEAKLKRKELSQESEFYGAMDGAAKFVSGDASAGLIITGINIAGGLFIGILMHDMDWMLAAETFTLLTIGDGLVSQIPSIIISVASGLIVARAASSGEDLGTEVIGQMTLSDKPLWLTSATCASLALVPGLPFIPFALLGVMTGTAGFFRLKAINALKAPLKGPKRAGDKGGAVADENETKGPKPGSTEEVTTLLGIDTLELEVGYELVSLVETGDLVERIRSLRRQFAIDYGFIVPAIHIRDNVRLEPAQYRLLLKGAVIGEGILKSNHLLGMNPGNVSVEIEGIPTKEPAFGLDAIWIHETEKERAQFAGYTVVDLSTVVTTHLTELVRSNMSELLGRQEVQHLLDTVAEKAPKVVEELVPSLLSLGQVQQVLCHLLREEISIRDLRSILETLADWAPSVKNPERLAEFARRKLSRLITSKFVTEEGMLPLVTLAPQVERYLGESLQHNDEGSYLALEPAIAQYLINRLSKSAEAFAENGYTPLILTSNQLRAALAGFVHKFVPGYSVIAHQEIASQTKVQSLGVVNLEQPAKPAVAQQAQR